jgi:hypothetical protein
MFPFLGTNGGGYPDREICPGTNELLVGFVELPIFWLAFNLRNLRHWLVIRAICRSLVTSGHSSSGLPQTMNAVPFPGCDP